jgi:hypothetical protein
MAESEDDRVRLVLAYIEAAQRARATGQTADWDAVRRFPCSGRRVQDGKSLD